MSLRNVICAALLLLLASCAPEATESGGRSTSTKDGDGNAFALDLSWTLGDSSANDAVTGYNVYVSHEGDAATQRLGTIELEGAAAKSKTIDTKTFPELLAYSGAAACFALTAVNGDGESEKSEQVCVDLP